MKQAAKKTPLIALILVIVFLAGAGFGAGINELTGNSNSQYPTVVTGADRDTQAAEQQKQTSIDFSLFWDVWETVQKRHVHNGDINDVVR